MKKTISINISGVIFHIEEDGYDKLKNYLASIQQYFSGYEDSQEIVTDIENRIAEKLLAKLKGDKHTEARQAGPRSAITLEDVNELIKAMGTVADFEAVEEEEVFLGKEQSAESKPQYAQNPGPGAQGSTPPNPTPYTPGATPPPQGPRRIFRDLRRKTLGGVASGLAHYFNIDPVWVRLVMVILVIGLPPVFGPHGGGEFFGSLAGFTIIAYIAMWVAFPGSETLEEDKSIKKFYRNPDDKVLGGIASGISAYFGIDTGVVRLLFVLGIVLFGVGFLAYIVLWIISPEANTLTEKMEMKGQPITLSNIENNVKRSLNISETAEENPVTKLLLFPFRAIAVVLTGLARAFGPFLNGLVAVVRVFVGVIMLIISFATMIACLGVAGVALGANLGSDMGDLEFPLRLFRQDIGTPMVFAALVAAILPCLALGIVGLMLIAKRSLISPRTALTLLGIWILALVVTSATVTPLVANFRRQATVEEEKLLNIPVAVPTFDINDVDSDYDQRPDIELMGYDGTQYKLMQRFEAHGRSRTDAEANARTIRYNYVQRDSVLRFDDDIDLTPNAPFRDQELHMELYIPYEKPFRMTKDFAYFIRNEFGNKELERMSESLWKFTKADGLVCINFPRERRDNYDNEDNDDLGDVADDVQNAIDNELGDDFDRQGDHSRQFDARDFTDIDASGAFVIRLQKGDSFKIVADGREKDMDDLRVETEGGVLKVSMKRGKLFSWNNSRAVGLTITMPTVKGMKLTGASRASLTGFGRLNDLDIDLTGASRVVADADVNTLKIDLTGASKATLRGRADNLEADLSGACRLDATEMTINRANIDANGASHAELGTVTNLDTETSGASRVTRRNQ